MLEKGIVCSAFLADFQRHNVAADYRERCSHFFVPFFTTAGLLALSFFAVGSATGQRQTAQSIRGFLINNNGRNLILFTFLYFFFRSCSIWKCQTCVIWAFKRSLTVFVQSQL